MKNCLLGFAVVKLYKIYFEGESEMKLNKTVALILAFVTVFGVFAPTFASVKVETKEILTSGDFVFERVDGNSILLEYTGTDKNVEIPLMLGTCFVTAIGEYAFAFNDAVESITVPEKVNIIMNEAFAFCEALKTVNIPASVTEIWDGAFKNCLSLENINVDEANTVFCDIDGVLYTKAKDIIVSYPIGKTATAYEIPQTVTIIGESAFEGCRTLEKVTIPNGVISIGNLAFWDCDGLTTISIPESVDSIGEYAFYSCDFLENVSLSKNVTVIGEYAFCADSNLKGIEVDPENPNYCDVDGVLFSKDKRTLITYAAGKQEESYFIPDTVNVIGCGAMGGNYNLRSVTIPESVEIIEGWAFDGAGALESIFIPQSVDMIGISAFRYCYMLKNIEVSENNKEYCSEDGVLYNKSKTELVAYPAGKADTQYTVPNGVTTIDPSAFCFANNLKSITLADTVSSIADDAFELCTALESIVIPKSITYIADYNIFFDCEAIVIYGEAGSYAEEYARTHGIPFAEGLNPPDSGVTIIQTGDINCDGKLNSRDVAVLQKFLLGMQELVTEEQMLADYNKDGKVNSRDIAAIQKKLLS